MMDVYEYAVIRYVPDVEREEFLNVGLLMMCKHRRWIRAQIELNEDRLARFDAPHPAAYISDQLRTFSHTDGPIGQLPVEERFRWLSAVKSSCLQTSRPHPGLTDDPDATFEDLFTRLVR